MKKDTIRACSSDVQQRYASMIASTVLLDLTFHRFGSKRAADLDGVKMETHLSSTGDVEDVPVTEAAF